MFLIMFNTGHALPLPGGRSSCPRRSRGGDAACPRENNDSCPRTRNVHVPDPATDRSRTRTVHVREQSVTSFSPRPQTCPRTSPRPRTGNGLDSPRVRHWQRTRTVRGQSADSDCPRPRSGHDRDLSANLRLSRTVRIAASSCPFSRPINFPVHIRIIPAYVLI